MDIKLSRKDKLNLGPMYPNKEDIMAKKRSTSRKTARRSKKTSARKTKTRKTRRTKRSTARK